MNSLKTKRLSFIFLFPIPFFFVFLYTHKHKHACCYTLPHFLQFRGLHNKKLVTTPVSHWIIITLNIKVTIQDSSHMHASGHRERRKERAQCFYSYSLLPGLLQYTVVVKIFKWHVTYIIYLFYQHGIGFCVNCILSGSR